MNSLVRASSQFRLTPERLARILTDLEAQLAGRVDAAYVFGSVSTAEFTEDSDIDLILVSSAQTAPFVKRPLAFVDLFDIYPKLDILVYTPDELTRQLADSEIGFWKSVRLTMRQII